MTSVLLIFIDGLGIGSRGPQNPLDGLAGAEPLAQFKEEALTTIHNGIVVPTDATLGVEGRPQSASGKRRSSLASTRRRSSVITNRDFPTKQCGRSFASIRFSCN